MIKEIEISGIKAKPGTIEKALIKIGERHDCSEIKMPLIIVNGSFDGPKLLIEAGAHADELIGTVAAIKLATEIIPTELHGMLVVLPVANMGAFISMSRHNAMEYPQGIDVRHEMRYIRQRGPRLGNLTERCAAAVVKVYEDTDANCVISCHSSAKESVNYPRALIAGTYVPMSQELREKTDKMAIAAGWEVTYRPTSTEKYPYMYFQVSSRTRPELKLLRITLETGAAPTLLDLETEYQGLKNIMIHLGMINGKLESCVAEGRKQVWVDKLCALNANKGGLFVSNVKLGAHVKKDQLLGYIINLFHEVIEEFNAPYDGIIIKIATMAFATTGLRCFVLATPYSEAK